MHADRAGATELAETVAPEWRKIRRSAQASMPPWSRPGRQGTQRHGGGRLEEGGQDGGPVVMGHTTDRRRRGGAVAEGSNGGN